MSLSFAITPSQKDTLDLGPVAASPEEFTSILKECAEDVGEKHGAAAIFATFEPCPDNKCRGTGKVRCDGGLHRLDANVRSMTAFAIDSDHLTPEQLVGLIGALVGDGVMFWLWETFGHTPTAPRVRVVIPFTEPMPIARPSAWRDVAWPTLVKRFKVGEFIDVSCKNPSHVYFLPIRPTADAVRQVHFFAGALFDWRPLLGDALEHFQPAPDIGEIEPDAEEDLTRQVDLESVRERLRTRIRSPRDKVFIDRVLKGQAPAPPPQGRAASEPSRYESWMAVTVALANVREPWEARTACLELLRDAYAATVADGWKYTWETVVSLFEGACRSAPARRAQKQADRDARHAAQIEVLKRALQRDDPEPPRLVQEDFEDLEAARAQSEAGMQRADIIEAELFPTPPPESPAAPWADGLIVETRKNGETVVKSCAANVEHILRKSPSWRGVFRLNLVRNQIEMVGGPLCGDGGDQSFRDEIVTRVADWFQRQPGYGFQLADSTIGSRIYAVAQSNAYDPLQDHLRALRWDGVPRIDTAFECYFNAPDGRVISRKWFLSAVARALDPGCKVDTVLVFEGAQGKKKSTALSILGGQWHTDQYIDLHHKDGWSVITRSWLVELGELAALKSEVNAQKAFFSQREDVFRAPYGRTTMTYPRRAIFIGTTNLDDYLKDETGNRRFWPLTAGEIDEDALRRDRDQLLAEAVAIFDASATCPDCLRLPRRCNAHAWWLSPEEEAAIEEKRDLRVAPDGYADAIERGILSLPVGERPDWVDTVWIAEKCLGRKDPTDRAVEVRIGVAMRRLKFVRERRMVSGRRAHGYRVPADLLTAPMRQSTSASTSALVRQSQFPKEGLKA